MPLLILLVLAICVGAVELWTMIQVGQAIGALATIGALFLFSALGVALVRREGARTWRSFQQAVSTGRPPGRELSDGVLILIGGVLMIVPGFVTGAIGLLLLLPPTRALLRGAMLAGLLRGARTRVIKVQSHRVPDDQRTIDGETDK